MHLRRDIEHQFNLLIKKQNTMCTRTLTEQSKKKMIAQGPLYICTCCDQLWYKHGVVNANKLRESNPNICEYLCNKTSVDITVLH